MKYAYYCLNCGLLTNLDVHGRCLHCDSEAVVSCDRHLAGVKKSSLAATLTIVLLFATLATAQEHSFVNRWLLIENGANATLRIIDARNTCIVLAHGGHEDLTPSQSCAVIAAVNLIGIPIQVGAQYLLHRRGWHKAERFAGWILPASSVAGLSYSQYNRNHTH